MSSLLKQNGIQSYKPFKYPEAYMRYEQHDKARWSKDEIQLSQDVKDWAKLSHAEQEFLRYTFLLFTQNDVCVGSGYDALIRCFKPTEIQMMLRNEADRENIHIDAYSYLLDTLGFPETIYKEFQEIEVMSDKLQFVEQAKIKKFEEYRDEILAMCPNLSEPELRLAVDKKFREDLAYMLAVYVGCTEGVSLFAQFALLLSYQLHNLMPGMCQIVTWSIRDEEMHCANNSWLFKELIKENLDIWTPTLKHKIYSAFREVVAKEKAYLDYIYDRGQTPIIKKEEMYQYLEYIADRRLQGLGLKANFGVTENPLTWMTALLNTPEFANFFTTQVTEYGRGATSGSWDSIRESLRD